MKFTIVTNDIPRKKWDKNTRQSIIPLLEEFVRSKAEIARVDTEPYEYSSPESLQHSVTQSVVRSGLPVQVIKRGTEIYIRRK